MTPWSKGGATSLDNGNGLCAACNQKELAGETARVVRDEDGERRTVRWTTRHGRARPGARSTSIRSAPTDDDARERPRTPEKPR
ncbi:HNH endonuclease [Brachybacterium sp. GPGPB12]|uniref:HNH endonuclease n=1 Tax=Brachybacterium sp. GPGPB12 TaxID=3023517 RepID=UPI0031342FA7